jgi:hypothetical protein
VGNYSRGNVVIVNGDMEIPHHIISEVIDGKDLDIILSRAIVATCLQTYNTP